MYTYFYLTNKKIKSLGWSTWLQKQSTFRKLDRGQNHDLHTKYERDQYLYGCLQRPAEGEPL